MPSIVRRALAVAALVALPGALVAQQQTVEMTQEQFDASLHWQTGDVVLAGIATVHLSPGYRYLGPTDAEKVLTTWGNLPGHQSLGMIFPANMSPVEDGA